MIIQVTQRDIDYGKQGNCFCCPVANALGAVLNTGVFFRVWSFKIVIGEVRFQSPKSVAEFVYAFDEGKEVFPFEFELPIPDELLRPEFRSSAEPSEVDASDGSQGDDNDGQ